MSFYGMRFGRPFVNLICEGNGFNPFKHSSDDVLPIFIFIILLRLILSGTFTVFFSIWRLLLIFVAAVIILIAAVTAVTSIRQLDPFFGCVL